MILSSRSRSRPPGRGRRGGLGWFWFGGAHRQASSVRGSRLRPGLAAELLQGLGVVDHVLQQLLELVVAVHLVEQVRQPLADLQQLAERLDLPGDLLGLEVGACCLNFSSTSILLPSSWSALSTWIASRGLVAGQDLVEVVAIDLDELALLQPGQRLLGLAREVGQDADDERQLLLLDRPVDLDVVGDVDAGLPHAVQLVLGALGRWHGVISGGGRAGQERDRPPWDVYSLSSE